MNKLGVLGHIAYHRARAWGVALSTVTLAMAGVGALPAVAYGETIHGETVHGETVHAGTAHHASTVNHSLPGQLIEAGQPVEQDQRLDGVPVVLAQAGTDRFYCHRIPALTTATNGWLLAAWDGRPGACGDAPQANSILQRISKDGGKTWEPYTIVAQGKEIGLKEGYSDPSYVVDRETGHIFLFFVKSFDRGWADSLPGVDPANRNVLHAAVVRSSDHGQTWSEPELITQSITNDQVNWRSRFAASGEGIQKQYAPHKGRLIQQYTIRNGGLGAAFNQAVSIYSDDHGATWKAGEPFGSFMDENKVVELANGDVVVNSRSAKPGESARRIATSHDGGEHYGDVHVERGLIDPQNNAGILRAFPDAPPGSPEASILLFSHAKDRKTRVNGHISVSFDNGRTWSMSKQFDPDGMSYSTITHLRDAKGRIIPGKYAMLYEEPWNQIRYMPFSWDWLMFSKVRVSGVNREAQRGVLKFTFTVTNGEDKPITGAILRPNPIEGWKWRTPQVSLERLEPGQSVSVEVVGEVGASQNPGDVPVGATVFFGQGNMVRGSLIASFKLGKNQYPSGCLRDHIQVVNATTLPTQPGQGISHLFDNLPNTIWHTPYDAIAPLPLSIDMAFTYHRGILALIPQPRLAQLNGRFNDVSVYLVKNGVEYPVVPRQSISKNQRLSLSRLGTMATEGERIVLRLKVHSTLDDAIENRYASLGELCVESIDRSPITYDETTGKTTPPSTQPNRPAPPISPAPPIPPAPPVAPAPPAPLVPQPGPSTTPSGKRTIRRLAGESRIETAVHVAQADFPGHADTVIVARADVHADSVAAAPLARALTAPILLTQSSVLHPATAAAIKRLQPNGGRVIIMGGHQAIEPAVEAALLNQGAVVERIQGPNRAATAVATATTLSKIGQVNQILLADGADWQPTLIAGPVAAHVRGVTLLTNGNSMAPETAAYLQTLGPITQTAIGERAASASQATHVITGDDPTTLSVRVAQAFFAQPKQVGLATTVDFADALAGGAYIARRESPLILVPQTTPQVLSDWFKKESQLNEVVIFGGETRIGNPQIEALTT